LSNLTFFKISAKIFESIFIFLAVCSCKLAVNVLRLHEVAMNQDQALTNILKLLIKNLSLF
ncbi:hypothetical protein, partial [Flavobacterium psychrophilum]|uniref:hypothetical protein n=1 Tax=Flavobacterium psychrophilum TaxID=96345 RepID=UPI001C5F07BB